MKFIFTADWHIKTKFKDIPLGWLADRYVEFLYWLEEQRIATGATALVIGGDVFDNIPSIFDVALFSSVFHVTNFEEYMIYPGNHEMLNKHKSFYETVHKILVPYKKLTMIYDKLERWHDWLVVPYPLIKTVALPTAPTRIMSHVRAKSDRGLYDAEIDFNCFVEHPVVLLGDIHEHRQVSGHSNCWYSGAPYDTSMAPLPLSDKYVLLVDGDSVTPIPRLDKFRRLIKIETTKDHYLSVKEKVAQSKHFYDIEVIVDNINDLRDLADLDVKKKMRKSKYDLDASKTPEEQMLEYLTDVLAMPNEEASKTLTVYQEL